MPGTKAVMGPSSSSSVLEGNTCGMLLKNYIYRESLTFTECSDLTEAGSVF